MTACLANTRLCGPTGRPEAASLRSDTCQSDTTSATAAETSRFGLSRTGPCGSQVPLHTAGPCVLWTCVVSSTTCDRTLGCVVRPTGAEPALLFLFCFIFPCPGGGLCYRSSPQGPVQRQFVLTGVDLTPPALLSPHGCGYGGFSTGNESRRTPLEQF